MWFSERGGKNPKSVWCDDEVKSAVRRKEGPWKEVLAATDEDVKRKMYGSTHRKKRERLKGVYVRAKRK